MSDPINTRLERRWQELMLRAEILEAEATGEGEWADGARLALHAAFDEARFLRDLRELQVLIMMRKRWQL